METTGSIIKKGGILKTKMLLLLLLCVLSALRSETLFIYKTDGTYLQFDTQEIADLTFDDVADEVIQIHKIDATTIEIAISLIDNIEFPTGMMLINKSDGTTEPIETSSIVNISFLENSSIDETSELINTFSINALENYPNPFNPETTISFSLNESGLTKIEIYNIKGEKVEKLLASKLSAGSHQIKWKGIDKQSKTLPSGIYFYKISLNGIHKINKMLLLK